MNKQHSSDQAGSAYYLPKPETDLDLVSVGRGTPGGELLRRYWHPVVVASEVGDVPVAVRALGEDLILFKSLSGQFGLVYPRCCHRGTTLYYGKVEDRGIRCCYHGWLFGTDGKCLDQPCEPNGGDKRDNYRQPWYPVEKRYGLVFAYMGPPDRMPILPRYEALEALAPGEWIEPDGRSLGSGGDVIAPCNWFQHWENVMDPYHVAILHSAFSGIQFVPEMAIMPNVSFEPSPLGVTSTQVRNVDGKVFRRVTEVAMPTLRVVPNPWAPAFNRPVESIGWTLPIDDTHYRIFTAGRASESGPHYFPPKGLRSGNRRWQDMSEEERQRAPGDWEAQVGQGSITFHSEEHLASSDRGVAMLRRFFRKQIEIVAAGGNPAGVVFEHDAPVRFRAGNYLEEPARVSV
jgi:phenylpropionate dioxygenase-like ring-hydroxylating dioxygenase large terminal subunit